MIPVIAKILVFITMVFFHIIDDFYLQGSLGQLKQKSWWKENHPDSLYRYDYITALIIHGFSWTCMIHIPIFVFYIYYGISLSLFSVLSISGLFILNVFIHAYVDHMKCNRMELNLTADQLIHIIYIFLTYYIDMILVI